MIDIVHVISGLHAGGGAEAMLYRLVSGMDRASFRTRVVSLIDLGLVGRQIQRLGVPVKALGMRRGVPDPRALWQLTRYLRECRPDVVQTWMYHANLIGALASTLAGQIPTVWGIHHSNLEPRLNKRLTLWTARTCAQLSPYLPAEIVCCSEAARRVHADLGYAKKKIVVIPNGVDVSLFRSNPESRASVRQELKIPGSAALIGMVARFHPLKDHQSFVRAAGILHRSLPGAHFLLCGEGVTRDNRDLVGWLNKEGLTSCCHLLGAREDIPRLMASLDVATLSSVGEAFPCVIVEAMACEVPCVVTDVGDSALIVADSGITVLPRDPRSLAEGWRSLLEPGRKSQLGVAARRRVEQHFSLPAMVARYERVYRQVLSDDRGRESAA